jgi:MFS family permease
MPLFKAGSAPELSNPLVRSQSIGAGGSFVNSAPLVEQLFHYWRMAGRGLAIGGNAGPGSLMPVGARLGGGIMPLHYTRIFSIIALLTVIAFVLWQVWIAVFEGQTFEEVTSTPSAPSTGQAAPAE